MNEYYMEIALQEAKKALKYSEVPVGAVIIKNNKIISKAHNKKEKTKNVINHAEILAIIKASKKLKNWRLNDCIMYVTMEPCMMCSGAIEQSRIKKVVFGINNEKYGYIKNLKNTEIVSDVCTEKCKNLIQQFFQKRR